MNYEAVGFDVSDREIKENGNVELYVNKQSLTEASESWLYTHQLHDADAQVSIRGVGHCPRHGYFSIVRQHGD